MRQERKKKENHTVEFIAEESKHANAGLIEKQMELLKTFLEHNAISQEQYEKGVHYLKENKTTE